MVGAHKKVIRRLVSSGWLEFVILKIWVRFVSACFVGRDVWRSHGTYLLWSLTWWETWPLYIHSWVLVGHNLTLSKNKFHEIVEHFKEVLLNYTGKSPDLESGWSQLCWITDFQNKFSIFKSLLIWWCFI